MNHIIALIAILGIYSTEGKCPNGTFPGINTQYHQCFQYINTAKGWYQADEHCKTIYGGHLASLHAGDVNDYVVEQVLKLKHDLDLIWLGAFTQNSCDDNGCGNRWNWVDQSDFTYSNFKPGHNGSEDGQGSALNLTDKFWYAYDEDSKKLGYLCKFTDQAFTTTPAPPPACPSGTFQGVVPGECFQYFDRKLEWGPAQESCLLNGGNLASIHDAFSNSFLKRNLTSAYGRIWVGLEVVYGGCHTFGGCQYSWSWVDDSNYDYTNFANGQDEPDSWQSAAFDATNGFWYSTLNTTNLSYLCKIVL